MEGPGLAARLEALLQQLAAGVGTADEAGQIFIQADSLAEDAAAWRAADHSQEEAEALRSVINSAAGGLAASLRTLGQQLSRARGGYAGATDQLCLDAACNAVVACLAVARPCGARSEARLQLAQAGISCLVSGGRLRLRESQSGAGAPPAFEGASLRVKLRQQMQLATLCIRVPTQTAETATKAATAAQLASWMSAVVHGMKRLGEERQTAQMQRELLPAFADMCSLLLDSPAWAAHADAVAELPLAADIAGLCLALLSVLAVSLPLPEQRRPAGCTWNGPFQLSKLLSGGGGPLHAGLTAYIRAADSGSISAAVAATAQLMQHVPLDQPPPGFSREHTHLMLATTSLLANLCVLAGEDVNVCWRLSDQQRRRVAKQVLPAIGRLPQLLQLASGGKQADLTGDEPMAVFGVVASAHCIMMLLHTFYQCPSSVSQLPRAVLVSGLADVTAWCSAASGALQCMPLVQQLHTMLRQQAGAAAQLQLPREHLRTPAVFATAAVEMAQLAAVCALTARQQAGTTAAVDSTVHMAAWQLHSRAAQLVHFSAGAADPLINLGDDGASGRLLCALTECFTTATALRHYDCGQPEPTSDAALLRRRQLQALCAEHAAALLACNARRPLAQHDPDTVITTLYSLAAAIADGPVAVGLDPALHALFDQLWSKVARGGRQRREEAWPVVLETARHGPFLVALLASGGYLETVVQSAGQDDALLEVVFAALDTLGSAAVESVAAAYEATGDSSNDASATPATDDAAVVERVSQAVEAFRTVMPPNSNPSSGQWRDVLTAARRLAATLLDWWRRPGAQQEQQLEAAQAAAARSCAYLRCANLGGGGGPAAGQGEGSQRCSACRAVWYCGTACSHADWRAGHRRVCTALGAARAAAKAARAAEAARPVQEPAE